MQKSRHFHRSNFVVYGLIDLKTRHISWVSSLETWNGFDITNAISGLVPGLIEWCVR